MLTRLTLLLFVLYALPWHLWPGLLAGAGLFGLLWRSRYRDGFLWFASLPGLYHFWGASLQTPSLAAAFSDWGLTAVGLLLFGAAARQEGWAVLWLVPLLILRLDGTALALLVLAHAVHVLERERLRSSEVGRPLGWTRTALFAALGLLGLLALALAALPVRVSLDLGGYPSPSAPVQPSPPWSEPGSGPPESLRPRVIPAEPTPFSRFAERAGQALLPVILGLAALTLSLLGWAARRAPPSRRRPRGFYLVPLILAAFFGVMLLAWLGTHPQAELSGTAPLSLPGLGPSAPEGAARPLPPPIRQGVDWAYALGLGMALVTTAGLVLLALALWRGLREAAQSPQVPSRLPPGAPPGETPSSRIRQAYRRFLQQMQRQGLPRAPFESPREYAQRLGTLAPGALPALCELTELYEPVRYGRSSQEAKAERAEALAQTLPALFSERQTP
ncbi:MAG: hypothetical protein C4327_05340 [Meiothermus sp.]